MIEARIRSCIEAYVAAWNEHEPASRERLIEQACTADVIVRTSGRRLEGRDALAELIADFQRRRPDARAIFSSAIDVQGNLFRYTGFVETADRARSGDTLDAGECDDDGRIRTLLLFVGAAPPPPQC